MTTVQPARSSFFFLMATPTTEIYTLSLHDALPIYYLRGALQSGGVAVVIATAEHQRAFEERMAEAGVDLRSEEHTSELQSRVDLVCRLLLEKKKNVECAESQLVKGRRHVGHHVRDG